VGFACDPGAAYLGAPVYPEPPRRVQPMLEQIEPVSIVHEKISLPFRID